MAVPISKPGGEAGVGVAVAQVGKGEQGLAAGVQPPPSAFALLQRLKG